MVTAFEKASYTLEVRLGGVLLKRRILHLERNGRRG